MEDKLVIKSAALVAACQSHLQKSVNMDVAEEDEEMSTLQQQRMMVEQLRREAAIKPIHVSQAVDDLRKYIVEHENEDCLLMGFHSQKANPFREKSSCSIL